MDLRLPIGLFFTLLSVILFATAALGDAPGSSLNAYCGAAMAVFGGVMLWLAKRRA